MPYTIDIHQEDGVFISTFGTEGLHKKEFEPYIQEVIALNTTFDQAGFMQVYHIIQLSGIQAQFDFSEVFGVLSSLRQNRQMVELRNRLNSLSILVTNSSATTQLIESMLSNANYGGRRIALFPTVDKAFDFIRFDRANSSTSSKDDV